MINTNMFDNYVYIDPTYIPDNTTPVVEEVGIKDIIRGGTPEHFFVFPFTPKEINHLNIMYKQNLKMIVDRNETEISWGDSESDHVAYVQLTSAETSEFEAIDSMPCFIQARAELKNGDVIYSDIYEVKILETLGLEEVE